MGWTEEQGVVQFMAEERQIKFVVPAPAAAEFVRTKAGQQRSTAQLKNAIAAEERRRWRALLLVIKAKLEAVQSGIVTFEEEFLAHVVMPDGRTVQQHVEEPIRRAYIEGHVRPLLAELKRRFDISVTEAGYQDQYRRALVGAGLVAADRAHLIEVLAAVERFVAARPEVELLSARQRELRSDD